MIHSDISSTLEDSVERCLSFHGQLFSPQENHELQFLFGDCEYPDARESASIGTSTKQ